jgi:hypothetical protein
MTNAKDQDLWLVIPTADRHQYLPEIFLNSGVDESRRVLVRTSPGLNVPDCVNIRFEGELNIQAWWNFGIGYALERGARYVAVLNDDVVLHPKTLQDMLSQMITDSSSLAIPVAEGAAGWGHCWILDTSHGVMPDERFVWWCGDHDLEIQARKVGGVTYFPIEVLNIHANQLTERSESFVDIVKRDMWRFRFKHPKLAFREALKKIVELVI